MWARQVSKNSSSKSYSFVPKSVLLSRTFSTRGSFTYKGNNYVAINKSFYPQTLKYTSQRAISITPVLRSSEPEPIVVEVPQGPPESDLVTKTEWIFKFSGILIVFGIALGLLSDYIGNNREEEREENLENNDEIVEGLQFLRLIPFKWLANQMASYSRKELTGDEIEERVRNYSKLYNISFSGLEKANVRDFKTFEEFFTRKYTKERVDTSFLLSQFRDGIYSPAEGTVMSIAKINSGLHKEYVKEEWYSAKQFLGFDPFDEAEKIKNERIQVIEDTLGEKVTRVPKPDMYMCVIYLGPGNYHRFHAPTDFAARKRIYFSGNYYPVRPAYLNFFAYRSLLGSNERVVLSGESEHGFFSMTPVAATNVGSIHLTKEPEFDNVSLATDREAIEYAEPIKYPVSGEVGHFSLGSTIVLVFEFLDGAINVVPKQNVNLGHPLVIKRDPTDAVTKPDLF